MISMVLVMSNTFKWEDLENLEEQPQQSLASILEDFGLKDQPQTPQDICTLTGTCEHCGEPYEWSGSLSEMPDSFCECGDDYEEN